MDLLRSAYEYERASGHYPFNPYVLNANHVLLIDRTWIAAYETYKQAVTAEVERLKKAKQGTRR